MMKLCPALILVGIFLYACSQESGPYPSVRFTYPGTNLSFVTPDDWSRTRIPSSEYQTFFTEIHYGINPNVQLEEYVRQGDPRELIADFLKEKRHMYPGYTVMDNSQFYPDSGVSGYKIKARRINAENTPVIHIHYVLYDSREVYIITATAAEPSFGQFENIFDRAMQTAAID